MFYCQVVRIIGDALWFTEVSRVCCMDERQLMLFAYNWLSVLFPQRVKHEVSQTHPLAQSNLYQ